MRIGFIGTGVITSALVTGLCTAEAAGDLSIRVSPRNRDRADYLARTFDPVTVGRDNQDVLDHADVVFAAILPDQMAEVLEPLRFRSDQVVVSLLAGAGIAAVAEVVAPARRVLRVLPLPCVSRHVGPVAIHPDDPEIRALLTPLGRVLAVENEAEMAHLVVITGLMAPYYKLLRTVVDWAEGAGADPKTASDYTAAMFAAFSRLVEDLPDGRVDPLLKDSLTPGGLNALALETIEADGGFRHIEAALKAVHRRIQS